MEEQRTRDATLVLRVWQEPDDSSIRARLICLPTGEKTVAMGTERILDAVAAALRSFDAGTGEGSATRG